MKQFVQLEIYNTGNAYPDFDLLCHEPKSKRRTNVIKKWSGSRHAIFLIFECNMFNDQKRDL